MMNQGGNAETIAPLDPNSLENRYNINANQGQTPSYPPLSTAGSEASSWNVHRTDNSSTDNGVHSHSTYQYDQQPQPPGSSTSSLGTVNAPQDYNSYASYQHSSDTYGYGSAGYPGYYNNYQQQSNTSYSQPVGAYQNTGAPYQPLSSFQNTGSYAGSASYSSTYYNPADYQTAGGYSSSSYNNQTTAWSDGNYANYTPHQYSQYTPDTTAAYSSITATSTSQNYEQHYKQWADYYSQTEVSCAPGTENISVTSTPNAGCPVPGATTGYQTSDSQLPPPPPLPSYAPSWRPEPSPSELPSVQSGAVVIGAHDGYWNHGAPTSQSQVHHNSSMQQHIQKPMDEKASYDSFQDHQKTAFSQAPNMQYPASQPVPHASHTYQSPLQPVRSHASHTYQSPSQPVPSHASHTYQSLSQPVPSHVSHTYQSPLQPVPSHASHTYQSPSKPAPPIGTQRDNKLQIPTNPRITSNPTFGLPKTDKDSCTTTAAAKPAYISVSLPKPVDKVTSSATADSLLKPGMFPKSLCGYVERALARYKDDRQKAACQSVMTEIITQATADGTLYTRDWDTEPIFPLPNEDAVNKEPPSVGFSLQSSNLVSSLPKYKRSPNKQSKSRWEPLPEEKPVEKPASVNNDSLKFSWMNVNDKQRKPWMGSAGFKDGNTSNGKFTPQEPKNGSKITQKPFKKQRLSYVLSTVENDDASSDSDKEQSLTAYYTGAMGLEDSPEERKRRENRSRRFERVQGHRAQNNHFKPKKAGGGNLYARRATALVLSKNFEDGGSRAVEDIDWDSLTVKGTCQEIEKCYLRLTSAPDPATVRPEDVLEKALLMVQNSQKNYLYKCDQLKSIRQDLTVQRIRNHLTVKVYETHARLAVEVGDLPEYNQCASQLKSLYAEGIEGCYMEFSAYNLLCVILHSNNNRDLVSSMASLSAEAKRDEAVKHALAVRSAVTSGNYVMFFRLYKTAPNLSTCLMDLYVEKMRYKAVSCICRSYRPTIPVPYVAQILGFTTSTPTNEESEEKDSEGLDECIEWLKVHGACLTVDNSGEMQLDTKPTSSSLYMPETDAVSHGDATLAVNDFLTRTPL
ncbi:SAC3 family protein A-like isoform X1 [Malus sylvestris]|uniref:SAC3 family protein A-like isoform X1 n=1 Tax=Malus sylvestris TaxID=3752 RepID=UPI0021AD07B3|nr:SAC3 family protein A-like isoform X1 [Malus sylvestris]XP_050119881.1 SAC3 family protein A-like isoform X1 [Malus sylvestris]